MKMAVDRTGTWTPVFCVLVMIGLGVVPAAAKSVRPIDAVYEPDQLDRLPELRHQETLRSTDETRQPRPSFLPDPAEAEVSLTIVVDRDGRVVEPAVVSSTDVRFDAVALQVVRHWKFDPGMLDGNPVRTRLKLILRFNPGRTGVSGEASGSTSAGD